MAQLSYPSAMDFAKPEIMPAIIDCLVDGGDLHLFIPQRWRQVLHVRLKEDDLPRLPVRQDLHV
jgi:hypothetical protein